MKILGIRTAPKQVRYALVEYDGTTCTLQNASTENILKIPAAITRSEEQLYWVKNELSRILRQNPDVSIVALKAPEFTGRQNSSSRVGDYLDAMVLLAAAEAGKTIVTKIYSQMSTKRSEVETHAEHRVGKTSNGWNPQMADAVAVAWTARQ